MARSPWIDNLVLRPLSVIYRMVIGIRNLMFKWGIFRQREFNIPVIVIGNLAVGGTGKTPHTELVVDMLRSRYNIAVLSRGYKRHTKGFILASPRSTPTDIGDEPYQIYHKFSCEIPVAVCESRVKGIEEIQRLLPETNLVILDDAFQHRYIKPTVSIVLTEFERPVYEDKMLPLGHLREPFKAINRADIVVVTKCPEEVRPIDYRVKTEKLGLMPFQKLFFSSYRYQNLAPVFPEALKKDGECMRLEQLDNTDAVLALSGIANPRPFIKWLRRSRAIVKSKSFPDHHNFQKKDLELILRLYEKLPVRGRRFIVTTEKDAVRLSNNPYFPPQLKAVTYYQPISIFVHRLSETSLTQAIEAKIKEAERIKNLKINP